MSDSEMPLIMREQAREGWLRIISEFRGESDRPWSVLQVRPSLAPELLSMQCLLGNDNDSV